MIKAKIFKDKSKSLWLIVERSGKADTHIDYEPMRRVFKCLLKNWRERK